jgi:hypothetical protein
MVSRWRVAPHLRDVQLKLWRKPMRDAARALDDVSDHLGEVLRRADELLVEWSRLGVQVRTQVEREVAAIGEVVDGAVARAAGAGLDRAIADRLRALTTELERLEQRTRAASRAVVEQREGDRRVLWIVVAGVVLANALLVALLLRKPEAAPVAEPIRLEAPAASTAQPDPTQPATSPAAAGSAAAISPATAGGTTAGAQEGLPGQNAGATGAPPASNTGTAAAPSPASAGTAAASPSSNAAASAGAGEKSGPPSNAAGRSGASASPGAATKTGAGAAPNAAAKQSASSPSSAGAVRAVNEPPRLTPSPIVLPRKSGNAHGHKKQ